MKCPLCAVDLVMADRQGIEIDYCPKCRGIWLDRGEIDKLIERSQTAEARPAPQAPAGFAAPSPGARGFAPSAYAPPPQAGWMPPPRREYDDDDDGRRRHGGKRRGGFLSEILDFD